MTLVLNPLDDIECGVNFVSGKLVELPMKSFVEVEEEDFSRLSYFPIDCVICESYFKKLLSVHWVAQEIPYASDRDDWRTLDDNTQRFVKFMLMLFAQADGLVNENLISRFKDDVSYIKDAKNFYAAQELNEIVHNQTYSLLIETFFSDPEEKKQAFNAIKYNPSIRKIADWVLKWMRSDAPLTERVIAFACLEGVFFSSAFAAIYWIKQKNVLKGLCKANEFIARDEGIHTEFAMALYHIITVGKHKRYDALPQERVHTIVSEAVLVIEEFNKEALPVDLVDINADDMIKYVKFVADSLVGGLGYEKLYDQDNPFDWMTLICLPNKSNFFETLVTEYSAAGEEDKDYTFDLEVEY